jgi:exodeoxyribonuclease-5
MGITDQVLFVLEKLKTNFSFTPTPGQERLFYVFSRFMTSYKIRCGVLLRGYAGTGKTTCISAMVRTIEDLGQSAVLLAPTGRAAKVMSNYSARVASTIHREIYNQKADRNGNAYFELRDNDRSNTVYIVDEASMIGTDLFVSGGDDMGSANLLDDLMAHVFAGENCRLVLVGDSAQLPPVGADHSPALDLSYLRDHYDLNIAEVELTEVIRQAQDSGILMNATDLRDLIASGEDKLPQIVSKGFTDVHLVRADLQEVLEEVKAKQGIDGMIIITRSNKRANLFNQQMRSRILWNEEEINNGDRMMVLRNNYFWLPIAENTKGAFIANGDIIRIERLGNYIEREGFRFCKASVTLIDFPDVEAFDTMLLCDTIWSEGPGLSKERSRELYQMVAADYVDLPPLQKKKAIKEDPYYNALHVKFAYAITCHKAQGGQWHSVFVDQGYVTDEMAGLELNRWFYTAFTRAQKDLYLVGFSENLIADEL